jgi:hypothetical protein
MAVDSGFWLDAWTRPSFDDFWNYFYEQRLSLFRQPHHCSLWLLNTKVFHNTLTAMLAVSFSQYNFFYKAPKRVLYVSKKSVLTSFYS